MNLKKIKELIKIYNNNQEEIRGIDIDNAFDDDFTIEDNQDLYDEKIEEIDKMETQNKDIASKLNEMDIWPEYHYTDTELKNIINKKVEE